MRAVAFTLLAIALAAPTALGGWPIVTYCAPSATAELSLGADCGAPNGGFEACAGCAPDAGDVPDRWTARPSWGASWTLAGAVEGLAAVRLAPGAAVASEPAAAVPGVHYSAGAGFAAVPGAADAVGEPVAALAVVFLDALGAEVARSAVSEPVGDEWTFLTVRGAVPPGAAFAQVEAGAVASHADHDEPGAPVLVDSAFLLLEVLYPLPGE